MRTLGPFRLLKQLGRGSSGTVYKAFDRRGGRVVAVKALHSSLARLLAAVLGLRRELAAGTALDHPNIGKVEALEELGDGTLLVVMPFYKGRTLDRSLVPLPLAEAVSIARQTALGLAHAHAADVIHCDVKPANLMLSAGEVKLLDFGLARLPGEDALAEGFLGTLEYMSPEAARGGALGPRSDLWSLGVVLYELLGGAAPFRSPSTAATLRRIVLHEAAPLSVAHPHLPKAVDRVLGRLLAKRPEARYENAEAFLDDLERLERGDARRVPRPHPEVLPQGGGGASGRLPDEPLLVGRDDEAALLALYLSDPACRLITILGLGGVGKTTLGLAAAHAQQRTGSFKEVTYIPLGGVGAGGLLPAVAAALGLAEATNAAVARAVGGRRHLLVLDNFEPLAAQAPVLTDLLRRCPHLTLLLTTQARLNLDAEWVLPLGGLAYPPDGRAGAEARRYGAVALFERTAKQRLPTFDLEAEGEGVVAICRSLRGHPLGLVLAAAWVDRLTPPELLAALGDFSPLRQGEGRHGSLWTVFESSERLLGDAERTLLARLGAFTDGFGLEAAKAVVGADEKALAALEDRSLLERSLEGRYRQHPALGQFCAERFAALPDAGSFRRRHRRFYRAQLGRADRWLRGVDQGQALELVGRDYANVCGAVGGGRSEFPATTLEPLRTFLTHQGRFTEGWALFRRVEGSYARACEAWFALLSGRLVEAEALSGRALAQSDVRTRLLALNVQAGVFWRSDDLAEAKRLSLEALELAQTSKEERMIATYAGNLALLEEAQGNVDGARGYYEQSLQLAQKRNDWAQTVLILNNLAVLQLGRGAADEARPLIEEGLLLCEQHTLLRIRPFLLSNLGLCLYAQGEAVHAVSAYREAYRMFTEHGDAATAASTQAYLGQALAAQGRRLEARRTLLEALRSAKLSDHKEGMLSALVRYAELVKEEDAAQARALAGLVAHHPQSEPADRALAKILAGRDGYAPGESDLETMSSRLLEAA